MKESGIGHYMPEIRVNEKYSHLVYSEFEDNDREKDSEPIIKRKTVFTTDYLKRISSGNLEGNIMPPNCRYIEKLSRGSIVVIEEPPAMRTVKLSMNLSNEVSTLQKDGRLEAYGYNKHDFKDRHSHKLSLAFPYVIFLLYISEYHEAQLGQVYVRPGQMSGLSDYICKIPLTNISDNQSVCFGEAQYAKQRSLNAAINHIIMVFWSAEFNTDYTYNYTAYKDAPILNSYLEWQYMSRENPMFIYNADWIKCARNIGAQIEQVKQELGERGQGEVGYRQLSDIFFTSQDSGKEVKATPKGRKTHKLFYDISQSTYLNSTIVASVGDTIKMKNGDFAYIASFAGFANGGEIKYILMDHNGKTFHIKYTDAAVKFLTKNIEDQRRAQKATLKNGVEVHPEDILIMKEGLSEVYRKISYIRRSRGEVGEVLEMKMGNNYYLTNKVEGKIFDIKKPEICGVAVDKDTEYIVIRESSNHQPMVPCGRYKYTGIDVGAGQTSLVARFKRLDRGAGSGYNLGLGNSYTSPPVIPVADVKPMDNLFRVGRKLLRATLDGKDPKQPSVWAHNGRVLYNNKYSLNRPNVEAIKSLLSGDVFKVSGSDFDTEFKVGDKVVVADWTDPLSVLNIKTIAGFKYDEGTADISFILMDKTENLTEVKYVLGNQGYILTGKIRKVTNKFEKLSVGTKIIAKEAGIAAFPKKDANIIVSIIIDGPHEPLVLCSNGCTLWYSTVMSKFERVTMKAKRWKTLQHAPLDLSKIKFQAGDIINGQNDYRSKEGYLLFVPSTSNTVRALTLTYYTGGSDSFVFDKYFASDAVFDSIPTPRIGPTKQLELGKTNGFYDFHGGMSGEYGSSYYSFINERGDIDV